MKENLCLNKQQLSVVNHKDGDAVVLASAGSGKTTVIVERVKALKASGVNSEDILCIAFNKNVRETLIDRIRDTNVNIETFHSLALSIIIENKKEKPTIWIDESAKNYCVRTALMGLGIRDAGKFVVTFRNIISKRLNGIMATNDKFTEEEIQSVCDEYAKYKAAAKKIEFDDFIPMACKLKTKRKFKYILIDEFQDISAQQMEFIELLNCKNIMIVGDPLQAIYSFRSGDVTQFDLFIEKHSPTIYHLPINYRCSGEIVDYSNQFAERIKYDNYEPSEAYRGRGIKPIKKCCSNEAKFIKSEINKHGFDYNDICVLARTNSDLIDIQQKFAEVGIPFSLNDSKVFTEKFEIKLMIEYLKWVGSKDDQALEFIYNRPNRNVGKMFIGRMKYLKKKSKTLYDTLKMNHTQATTKSAAEELVDLVDTIHDTEFNNVGEIIRYLRERLSIDEYVKHIVFEVDSDAIDNLDNLEKMASKYPTIKKFLNKLNKVKVSEEKNAITLSTIHRAKGLEYKTVFVVGCNEGNMPHHNSDNLEEEARIFYVAMTRAMDNLYLLYTSQPSQFLSKK